MRIAVLVSGRGSNLVAIHKSIAQGELEGVEIAGVISSKDAEGFRYALERRLNALLLEPKGYASREEYDRELVSVIEGWGVELVCLAGYMRILTPLFVKTFEGRLINIHPSLLPSFPGLDAQKQALSYGVKVSGCTVHFVDLGVDTGAVIAQSAVEVLGGDSAETLSARILEAEHRLYPKVLSLFAKGKVRLSAGKVFISL